MNFFHELDLFCEFNLFCEFASSAKSRSSMESVSSAITAQGLAVNQLSGGEKNCIVYSLFCIFFIIIISSVVLLNCGCLNPQVLLFIPSAPHLTEGWRSK